MKRRTFSEVVEIDGCKNDVVKVHVRFLEIVEKVAHGLTRFVRGFRDKDFAVRAGDEATFGQAVERIAGKNAS